MFSVQEIYRKDAATYYRGDPSKRVSRFPVHLRTAVLSLVAGMIVNVGSNDFLAGALSAEAILVGFSFNVLFYLVANRLTKPGTFADIEHELRFERLSRLSDEIFDNIIYFNVVAIFSALGALALLLLGSDHLTKVLEAAFCWITAPGRLRVEVVSWSAWAVRGLLLSGLVFLIAEGAITFLRCVTRVRFYFSMLQTMTADSASR